MWKRMLALICVLGLAVTLLSGCDLAGGAKPEPTNIPLLPTPAPTEKPTEAPTDAPADPTETPEATDTPTPTGPVLTPHPDETPIAIDPIDKPTPEPLNLPFTEYDSPSMGVKFERPANWTLDAPGDTNVQFKEPEASAVNGYRAMLTVRVYTKGSTQNKEDAKAQLLEILEEMSGQGWTNFEYRDPASATMSSASGYYAYYYATFNGKPLRGRITVVAKGSALYMMRLTCAQEIYTKYEDIYRRVRSSWSFNN